MNSYDEKLANTESGGTTDDNLTRLNHNGAASGRGRDDIGMASEDAAIASLADEIRKFIDEDEADESAEAGGIDQMTAVDQAKSVPNNIEIEEETASETAPDAEETVFIDPKAIQAAMDKQNSAPDSTSAEPAGKTDDVVDYDGWTDPDEEKDRKKEEKARRKRERQLEKERKKAGASDNGSGTMEEVKEEPPRKSHKVLKTVLLVILCVIAAAYVAGVVFFRFHFGVNTIINNVDCSYMTSAEVEKIIASQVADYKITIQERDNKKEAINGSDIDLKYVSDGQVDNLLVSQNAFLWPYRYLTSDQYGDTKTHASVTIDDAKLSAVVSKLNCADTSKMTASADAYPEIVGSVYSIHPEVLGTTLDVSALTEKLKEAITDTDTEFSIEDAGLYTNPTVLSTSETLIQTVDTFNKYASLSITYHFNDQTEVLDGATTSSWFTWDENLNPTLNQDAIKAWVADFASRHNTVGTTRTFTAANGSTAQVTGGTYGWKVDQSAEIDMINQMFTDMTSQDRDPQWSQTAVSFGATDWGNTYIDVSLTDQHIWYIQNGTSVFDCDVVTGLPTPEKETPQGVWSILEKLQNKILRGDRQTDGSYSYETKVAYWLRVTYSGVGFHDATWQPWFGGNRYTYAGSHGCINMSLSTVEQLYNLVATGTPVIVHY